MRFAIGEREFECQVREDEPEVSRHTGSSLRRLTIRFQAEESDPTPDPKRVTSSDDNTQWTVGSRTYTVRGDTSVHTWNLVQREVLRPTALHLNDLVLHPHSYEETFSGDELQIRARARLTKDEDKAFRDLVIEQGTVTVRREGVAQDSRDMSLNPHAWSSPDDDETFVWFFVLRDVQAGWRPALELTGMRAAANQGFTAFAIEWVAELGKALVDKGLLTEEEAAAVRDRAVEGAPNRSLSLLRVGNVDATTDDKED